jgi:hypothetical protein
MRILKISLTFVVIKVSFCYLLWSLFLKGVKIVFKVGLALLKYCQDELVSEVYLRAVS